MGMVKCGVCNKPIMVYIEQQTDDEFDNMIGDGEGTTCEKCGKEITVHQKTNVLDFECPEHGIIARMEKRGYCTWRCGCSQGYYADSKQQWWENESMRWVYGPAHKAAKKPLNVIIAEATMPDAPKKKRSRIPTFGAGAVVGAGVKIGDALIGTSKKIVGDKGASSN